MHVRAVNKIYEIYLKIIEKAFWDIINDGAGGRFIETWYKSDIALANLCDESIQEPLSPLPKKGRRIFCSGDDEGNDQRNGINGRSLPQSEKRLGEKGGKDLWIVLSVNKCGLL